MLLICTILKFCHLKKVEIADQCGKPVPDNARL